MYSGGGYTILQLMVEEVSGQSFATYMDENVLQPLGMESSTFTWSSAIQTRLASAYGTYYNRIPNQRYVEDAAGGLYSTAEDLARFAQAIVSGPCLLACLPLRPLACSLRARAMGLGTRCLICPPGSGMCLAEAHAWVGSPTLW